MSDWAIFPVLLHTVKTVETRAAEENELRSVLYRVEILSYRTIAHSQIGVDIVDDSVQDVGIPLQHIES